MPASDPDASKPYTMEYRGREQIIRPSLTMEDCRQQYEVKRRGSEAILRSCYEKTHGSPVYQGELAFW